MKRRNPTPWQKRASRRRHYQPVPRRRRPRVIFDPTYYVPPIDAPTSGDPKKAGYITKVGLAVAFAFWAIACVSEYLS